MPIVDFPGLQALLVRDGRLMALDVGSKTIGIATSDALRMLATPLTTPAERALARGRDRLLALQTDAGCALPAIGLGLCFCFWLSFPFPLGFLSSMARTSWLPFGKPRMTMMSGCPPLYPLRKPSFIWWLVVNAHQGPRWSLRQGRWCGCTQQHDSARRPPALPPSLEPQPK